MVYPLVWRFGETPSGSQRFIFSLLRFRCSTEPLQQSLSRQDAKSAKKRTLSFRPLRQAQDKLREKSFLDPSHSLGMTGQRPSLGVLCLPAAWQAGVFARGGGFSFCYPQFNPEFQKSLASFFSNSPRVIRYLNALRPLINSTGTSAPYLSWVSGEPSTSISASTSGVCAAT